MGPKKMYLCVVGIGKDQSNDTVFNYLEARSKRGIVYEESLRTEDNLEHAVIVFKDQIGIYIIHKVCFKRYIHTEKFVLEKKKCDNTKENTCKSKTFKGNKSCKT
jgi:aspartokinase-like uncharacterized kinase